MTDKKEIKTLEDIIELNIRDFQTCCDEKKREMYGNRIKEYSEKYKKLTGRYYKRL
jgi:hypothetical protein